MEKLQHSIDIICLKIEKQEHDLQHKMLKYKLINIFLLIYPLAIVFLLMWADIDHKRITDSYTYTQAILAELLKAVKYLG
jgi:hypothetical protein